MLILHDPVTLLHETVELLGAKLIPALESPLRIHAILNSLDSTSHEVQHLNFSDCPEGQKAWLLQLLSETHDEGYLQHLRTAHETWRSAGHIGERDSILPECFQLPSPSAGARAFQPPKDVFARPGFYAFDMSTGICKDSWLAIEASANLAATAATAAESMAGSSSRKSIMALCRPPGHHCTTAKAGGYCYVNSAVVAVHALQKQLIHGRKPRIATLDLDFHHGNGTQDYFYADPSVFYVSIHGKDEYPYYSGFEDEIGKGEGKGFNVNLPLEAGASIEQYLEKVDVMVERTRQYAPDFLVVSLGFDTFMLDPIGKFQIDTDDYERISTHVRSADGLKGVPSVILLEGGYVVDRIGRNLVSFLRGWERAEQQHSPV